MTILDFAATARSRRGAPTSIQLHDALWRVTRPNGEVLGYVEQLESDGRYRAKRMLVRQRRFVTVGDFWRFEDAMDCFTT